MLVLLVTCLVVSLDIRLLIHILASKMLLLHFLWLNGLIILVWLFILILLYEILLWIWLLRLFLFLVFFPFKTQYLLVVDLVGGCFEECSVVHSVDIYHLVRN